MKKILIILFVIVGGLYMLGDWASDPATIENQSKKLGEMTQQLNLKMAGLVEKMTDEQVAQAINNEKQMMNKMIQAVSSNPEMKKMFQDNLNKLSSISNKEEYIAYLKTKR